MLVVSTDPAHSLGDALEVELLPEPSRIKTRKGELLAAELDAGRALERWLGERRADLETLAERGTYLDPEDVRRLFDLSLPGVDELVGLVELVRLAEASGCDEIVVDTAPTAHTLRLLAMPGELRRFAEALDRLQERHRAVAGTFGGAYRPDRSDAAIDEIEAQGRELEELLRDPGRSGVRWVLLPEAMSVAETLDGVRALDEAGIPVVELIVNRVTPPPPVPCPLCEARRQAEGEAVRELREDFPGRPVRFLPELEREPRGLGALTALAKALAPSRPDLTLLSPLSHRPSTSRERGEKRAQHAAPAQSPDGRGRPSPGWWKGDGRGDGCEVRLLFFGGKGGVGKTTCAAATALLLAERWPDRRILLLSTDPAHSLADALEAPLGDDERPVPGAAPGLRARELDAPETFEEWRSRHLGEVEEWLDSAVDLDREALRDLLALAPPGLDELAAVSALIDSLSAHELVIVDTAPTGHALRLLETPGVMLEWVRTLLSLLLKYREAVRLGRFAEELLELSRGLKRLGETMRDPERTRFLAVTRAAELPRRETLRLLEALDRLGIAAPAVIVDAVLPAGCPRCEVEAAAQEEEIAHLRQDLDRAIILAPAVFPPPRGVETLKEWARTWTRTE